MCICSLPPRGLRPGSIAVIGPTSPENWVCGRNSVCYSHSQSDIPRLERSAITDRREQACELSVGACRIQVTDYAENVVLDEPNDVSAEDRSRGSVPACLGRLRGPVTFMIP